MNKKSASETYKKITSIPIACLIQEANDLYLFCKNDKEALVRDGLDWNEVEMLPVLLEGCTDAEAEYQLYKDKSQSEIVKLEKLVIRCRKLRTFISEKLRAASELGGNFLAVPSYRKRWSRVELIQDLNDLAVIGKDHNEILQSLSFDLTNLDLAANLSVELSEKMVDVIISKPSESPQKANRDKLKQELFILIARIRTVGKSAFIDNPLRRKVYACEYLREKKLRRKKAS
jgi:hypothetical protein